MTQERNAKELHAVARNVRRFRQTRDWSLAELAERAGMAPSYISNLENGKVPNPSLDALGAIATALGSSLRELLISDGDSPNLADFQGLWENLDEQGRDAARLLMSAWRLRLVAGELALNPLIGDEHRQVAA